MKELFYQNTFKYNNFQITEPEAVLYLNKLIKHKHFFTECMNPLIDYEKLIYIELHFPDNEKIQFLIKEIKKITADMWFQKQQLLNRIC